MGYDANPNGSDLTIVTVVLLCGVFATHTDVSGIFPVQVDGFIIKKYRMQAS